MKRRRTILRVFVFLLLGAIVNVTVAWGLDLNEGQNAMSIEYPRIVPDEDIEWWHANAPVGIGSEPGGSYSKHKMGQEFVMFHENVAGQTSGYGKERVGRWRYGWPCLSMERAAWKDESSKIFVPQHTIFVPRGLPKERHPLVCHPIWPGFAINTVFYAGVLWLLFAGPFALRRRSRRRRGLCVKCGYDLRGTGSAPNANACPECGATR